MGWKEVLKTVAPWLGTAVGGPLGGIAVEAIGAALGLSDKTEEAIKQAISGANPEQLLALKKADQDFQVQMKTLGLRREELTYQDRDSARKREVDTHDSTNRRLAFFIIGAFIAMVGATLLGYTKADSALAGTLIGYLSAKAEQVLAYYFGSSAGSKLKTDMLASKGDKNAGT